MGLSTRLQVLIERSQAKRLGLLTHRRGVSMAVVVRDAIDRKIGRAGSRRLAAADRILAATPIEVPTDERHLEDEIADEYRAT